jgi:two-component system alkaline phosphatase synthesis response regulator PhoP|uniref:Response regulator n=1 Tax=candidate division WOR-3 bacterium TaxID=2052148 RepID=A0A7V5XZ24_UNCW3
MENKHKILLVEDEENLREILKYQLENAGYQVYTAADGMEALNLARKYKVDLIILDLMLPKLDGFTVCRLLKFSEQYKKIPLIMITARTNPEDKERGLGMGADFYLTKPLNKEELLEKIAELLKPKEIPREA